MRLRDVLLNLVVIAALIVAGSLFLGQLLGQPVLLGYVETGSMHPTLSPGDGFVVMPLFLEGSIDQGDVIVFQAQNLHGGGLTTHRVVGETTNGFITKGDANPVTDQASGEPPVKRHQIVATALQLNGHVVAIPGLGELVAIVQGILTSVQRRLAVLVGSRALLGSRGLAYLLFASGIIAYVVSTVRHSGDRRSPRRRTRRSGMLDARYAVIALTGILILVLTVSMVAPAGTQTFSFVSSETDSPGPSVIHHGATEDLTYRVPSNGLIPVLTYFTSHEQSLRVEPDRVYVSSNSVSSTTVQLTAPPTTGAYSYAMTEHRYLAILPLGLIDTLHQVHPWVPIIAIDMFVGIGFMAGAAAIVGWGPVRVDKPGGRSVLTRLRRRLP